MSSESTRQAAAAAASVETAKRAAGAAPRVRAGGPGTGDPLVAELRRSGLLRLLVLHFAARGPCYGNQLMEQISTLTAGALSVNPNTMYPLLRTLESEGLIAGEWEHPERRSRRFYRVTPAGEAERVRLAEAIGARLDVVAESIERIRAEVAP